MLKSTNDKIFDMVKIIIGVLVFNFFLGFFNSCSERSKLNNIQEQLNVLSQQQQKMIDSQNKFTLEFGYLKKIMNITDINETLVQDKEVLQKNVNDQRKTIQNLKKKISQ